MEPMTLDEIGVLADGSHSEVERGGTLMGVNRGP
jgi:hypothetical protein